MPNASSLSTEAAIARLTQLAEAAIAGVREVKDQVIEQGRDSRQAALSLEKISVTQDEIARRLTKGSETMDNHENRIQQLEQAQAVDKAERAATLRTAKLLVNATWVAGGALWTGLVGALGLYWKLHG